MAESPARVRAYLIAPSLLSRMFTLRALAWVVLAWVSLSAGLGGRTSVILGYLGCAVFVVALLIDGMWALQSWGLMPIATAQVDEYGVAHIQVRSIRGDGAIDVKTTKKGAITHEIRRSRIGSVGLGQGWPTHDVLVFTSASGIELARLVPHGELAWR